MAAITRRSFLAGAATAAGALGTPAFAQSPKRGGTLRFIPIADLKILDPIWTTAYITRDHGYMIFDTLFATDANLPAPAADGRQVHGQPRRHEVLASRCATGSSSTTAQPVTAEDCVASLTRWGKKDAAGPAHDGVDRRGWPPTDKKTFVLEL